MKNEQQYKRIAGTTSRPTASLDHALVVKGSTVEVTIAGRSVTIPKAEAVQIIAERLSITNSEVASMRKRITVLESHLALLLAEVKRLTTQRSR